MPMLKYFTYSLIAITFWVSACVNNSPSNQAPGDNALVAQTKSEPDATDLLDVLQGKWQSEQDPNSRLEIAGNKMRHIVNGVLQVENIIEIDAKCQNNTCKQEGSDTSDGWCFVEKRQPDASNEQCNVVLKCDKQSLQYRTIGGLTNMMIFKKIP